MRVIQEETSFLKKRPADICPCLPIKHTAVTLQIVHPQMHKVQVKTTKRTIKPVSPQPKQTATECSYKLSQPESINLHLYQNGGRDKFYH